MKTANNTFGVSITRREAADPSIVLYKNKYWPFTSNKKIIDFRMICLTDSLLSPQACRD
ncbi:hypothetical protein [Mucilaginibacter sp. L196]|uniref:hypothetical protein n=1 Tax=Mucilaginibacter sp. L196 TaxID=1641870 RepID=UPI00131E8517|nr:hypothetical protein [Mucilaginibacter sp. L196]